MKNKELYLQKFSSKSIFVLLIFEGETFGKDSKEPPFYAAFCI